MALAAYRHLLRGIRIAFQSEYLKPTISPYSFQLLSYFPDDTPLLTQARLQARSDFQNHRDLDSTSHHVRERIQHAEQVAALLRHNLVQGTKIQGEGAEEKWHLNIHSDTELGDNDSVKIGGYGEGCCRDTSTAR
jgi:complex III assembly factor LYRM7